MLKSFQSTQLIFLVLVLLEANAAMGQPATRKLISSMTPDLPPDSICYFRRQDGVVVNLDRICGNSSGSSTAIRAETSIGVDISSPEYLEAMKLLDQQQHLENVEATATNVLR